MNKDEFLAQRAKREALRKSNLPRSYCFCCHRPTLRCLCHLIKPFETPMNFVFLMHTKEARKQLTGTGLLAHLSLANSELLIGQDFRDHPRVNEILANDQIFPMVLFPGDNVWDLTCRGSSRLPFEGRQPYLFVIDGTWVNARKVMYRSPCLQNLLRIGIFPKSESRFSIKRQPAPNCLSTIEACHAVLEQWNGPEGMPTSPYIDRLLHLLDGLVDFQSRCAVEVHKPRYPSKRRIKASK